MKKQSALYTANPTAHYTAETSELDDETDLEDAVDDENLELDAIELYQDAKLLEEIDPDHQDELEDAKTDLIHDSATPDDPSPTPVDEVPMPVTLSEIIAEQKTDDFCQTVFSTIGNIKSFFIQA